MGKRKSITGIRKKSKKIATLEGYTERSTAVVSSPSASPVIARNPRHRQLFATWKPLPRAQASDRASLPSSTILSETQTRPGSKGTGSLESYVKHVSQDIIRSKWTVLDADAQAKVEKILRSMELPILTNYSSEQRKLEAQVALRSITGSLCKRVPRMPFPPKAKEKFFDYETLVRDNHKMQQSLATSATSSAALLNEIKKEKLAYLSERQELEELEELEELDSTAQ